MNNKDILSQIIEWAKSTMYISKNGTDKVKAYQKGYEKGIQDAKEVILKIINSEQ